MKQRLIMENWRRFIKESTQANYNIPEGTKLYYNKDGGEISTILYKYDDRNGIEIVGSSLIESTDEPCIPDTLQMTKLHVNPSYRGQRLGRLLYDIAFYIADHMGYGLTSDRDWGSLEDSAREWPKFKKESEKEGGEYAFKKTNDGNEEFDYDRQTDDPNDDCYKADHNATDHSFVKTDPKSVEPIFIELEAAHNDFIDNFIRSGGKSRRFERNLRMASENSFFQSFNAAIEKQGL